MKHVAEIKKIIAQGQTEEAADALEDLLAIGPQNVEALKLRALLFAHKGQFNDEAKVWEKIIEVDNEDFDAIDYYRQRQLEDQEHFFFTEELPEGGRRFITYPKGMVQTAFYGLFGCLVFLTFGRLSRSIPALSGKYLMIAMFALMVLAPFIKIIFTWLTALRSVSVNRNGLVFSTRFKTLEYQWNDIENLYLAHSASVDQSSLSLIVKPIDGKRIAVELDLTENSTSVKARSHLLKELKRFNQTPEHVARNDLSLTKKQTISF